MNKKIYFDSRYILISESPVQPAENQLIIDAETQSQEQLKNNLNTFIQQSDQNNLILLSKNVNYSFGLVKQVFICIEAAGGLIKNSDKYLFIFRLKKWDLPKGKLDEGETIEHAAIRECEEECAIKELNITGQLPPTYHIYPYKGSFALKTSHWFIMESNYNGILIPQIEENIEKAEWLSKEQILETVTKNTYPAILDVITDGIGV